VGGKPEIEITPAMLKAGSEKLRDWLGDGRSDGATPEFLISAIIKEVVCSVLSSRAKLSFAD
jgi:hypothetical protein